MKDTKQKTPEEIIEENQPKADMDKKRMQGTFIMKVTHLSWGRECRRHFYADDKPEISAKVMREYSKTILIWLDAGWIEKGSYKK